jgi:hypothetical protein
LTIHGLPNNVHVDKKLELKWSLEWIYAKFRSTLTLHSTLDMIALYRNLMLQHNVHLRDHCRIVHGQNLPNLLLEYPKQQIIYRPRNLLILC